MSHYSSEPSSLFRGRKEALVQRTLVVIRSWKLSIMCGTFWQLLYHVTWDPHGGRNPGCTRGRGRDPRPLLGPLKRAIEYLMGNYSDLLVFLAWFEALELRLDGAEPGVHPGGVAGTTAPSTIFKEQTKVIKINLMQWGLKNKERFHSLFM